MNRRHLPSLTDVAAQLDALSEAAAWLHAGHLVVFPTDTFYGLAADPASESAVHEVFALKGRGPRAALPLVAASTSQVVELCGALDEVSRRLATHWWPGPLSLLVDAPPAICTAVHAGTRALAIRVPAHDVARRLAFAFGGPIIATSANLSGHPPARTVTALAEFVDDPRVLVIDGGETPGGAPSTIVDARGRTPHLVRDGAIAWNRVLESL